MYELFVNEKVNKVELKFDGVPSAEIRAIIKEHGFWWSSRKKMWSARINDVTRNIGNLIPDMEGKIEVHELPTFDLWEATRIDDNLNNLTEENKYEPLKNVTALIRKHLKERFPMCKFSVRTEGHSSMDITLKSSPFAKNSDELNAIIHYTYIFAKSYNWNNSDSMTDYFDVRFYGVYESSILDRYDYVQTEPTVKIVNICELFQKKKSEWETQETAREEREFQEFQRQMEQRKSEREKLEKIREENYKKVENAAVVEDVDYTIFGAKMSYSGKHNTIEQYMEDCEEGNFEREICEIKRKVSFDRESYNLFCNMLLNEWSFLAGTGGTRTYDNRVQVRMDYDRMSPEERKTVEWVYHNCVIVYCENEKKFIIDAEGFGYARYVALIDGECEIKHYYCNQEFSDEDFRDCQKVIESLLDYSTDIIVDNGWLNGKWLLGEDRKQYKTLLRKKMKEHHLELNVRLVQAMPEEYVNMKEVLYEILDDRNSLHEQFERAGLKPGQRITIVELGTFGWISASQVTVKNFECGQYAQYKDSVKLTFRPKKKHGWYQNWYHGDLMVYDGWIGDIPENVLFEISENGVVTTKRSRYASFDHAQYTAVYDYFKSCGYEPMIDTRHKA